MGPITDIFLSEVLGKPAVDLGGEGVGHVADLLVAHVRGLPHVIAATLRTRRGETVYAARSRLGYFNRRLLMLADASPLAAVPPRHDFGARALLDRQVVDVDGCKVVRVNDVLLRDDGVDTHLVGVDIGPWGIARRLGVGPLFRVAPGLKRRVPERIIAWDMVAVGSDVASPVALKYPYARLARLHPADIAGIVERLGAHERTAVIEALDAETAAEALEEVSPHLQASILEAVGDKRASGILEHMGLDEVTDLVRRLPGPRRQRILGLLDGADAQSVADLVGFADVSAGGLMTPECVSLPAYLTCDQAIAELREKAPSADLIYYIYVVDASGRLTGVVSLRDLIVSPPATLVSSIATTNVVRVEPGADVGELADRMNKYGLLALPVVDDEGILLGIVTVDDILEHLLPGTRHRSLAGAD